MQTSYLYWFGAKASQSWDRSIRFWIRSCSWAWCARAVRRTDSRITSATTASTRPTIHRLEEDPVVARVRLIVLDIAPQYRLWDSARKGRTCCATILADLGVDAVVAVGRVDHDWASR